MVLEFDSRGKREGMHENESRDAKLAARSLAQEAALERKPLLSTRRFLLDDTAAVTASAAELDRCGGRVVTEVCGTR